MGSVQGVDQGNAGFATLVFMALYHYLISLMCKGLSMCLLDISFTILKYMCLLLMQMLSRPLLVLTIAEALTDQSELKQEAPGGTASNASSESHSEPQASQSPSDIR